MVTIHILATAGTFAKKGFCLASVEASLADFTQKTYETLQSSQPEPDNQ
jgi:hypothetical protein